MSFLMPKVPDTETTGPRLDTLTVSESAFGSFLNRGQGTVRCDGQIIYASEIRETVITETEDVGGKGGGGGEVTSTTYEYHVDLAVAYARGPARAVPKIWMDTKVIKQATLGFEREGFNYRIYYGDENQEPDPLIYPSAALRNKGIAYRGVVYIVFENMPLKLFGNRIPIPTAEIRFIGGGGGVDGIETLDLNLEKIVGEAAEVKSVHFGMDFKNNEIVVNSDGLIGTYRGDPDTANIKGVLAPPPEVGDKDEGASNRTLIGGIDPSTGDVIVDYLQELVININSFRQIVLHKRAGSDTFRYTRLNGLQTFFFDPEIDEIGPARFGGGFINKRFGGADHRGYFSRGTNEADTAFEIRGHLPDYGFAYMNTWEMLDVGMSNYVQPNPGAGFGIMMTWSDTRIDFYRSVAKPSFSDPPVTLSHSLQGSVSASDIGATTLLAVPELNFISPIWYDETDSGVIAIINTDVGYILFKVNLSGEVLWTNTTPVWPYYEFDSGVNLYESGSHADNSDRVTGGYLAFYGNGDRPVVLDTLTGQFVAQWDGTVSHSETLGTGAQFWDGETSCIYTLVDNADNFQINKVCFDLSGEGFNEGDDGGVTLGEIVAAYCTERGLVENVDFDVSELTEEVKGYVVTDIIRGDEAIKPLAELYQFDIVEYDGKIYFPLRGKAATITLTEDDLIDQGSSSPYTEKGTQSKELPNEVNISYMRKRNRYEPAEVSQRLTRIPDFTMVTENVIQLSVPVVSRPGKMKNKAARLLYSGEIEKTEWSFRLPWTYIGSTPTDVFQLTLDDDFNFTGRINSWNLQTNLEINIKSVQQSAGSFVEGGDEEPPQFFDQDEDFTDSLENDPTIYETGDPDFIIFDLPLLSDDHATYGSAAGYYFTVVSASPLSEGAVYAGASILEEISDNVYTGRGLLTGESTTGNVDGVIPDLDPTMLNQFDDETTFDIIMKSGTLSSVTDLEVLSGSNLLAVVNSLGNSELISFANATLVDEDIYRVSRLIRGRKGTEKNGFSHSSGAAVALISGNVGRLTAALSTIGSAITYRPVTIGKTVESGAFFEQEYTLTGTTLKPYAPVKPSASMTDGDITFDWVRRTRFGGEWMDGIDTVPLNEETEEYTYTVTAVGDSTVIKTGVITSPQATLTSAERTTASATGRSAFEISVAQRSAIIGDGIEMVENVNVQNFRASEPPASRYWKLVFTDSFSGRTHFDNYSMAEVILHGLISDGVISGSGTASGSDDGVNVAANAFDSDDATYFRSATGSSAELKYDFGSGNDEIVGKVEITSPEDRTLLGETPIQFQLFYSSDDITYHPVDDIINLNKQDFNYPSQKTVGHSFPWASSTVLLMHFDGSNGDTGATLLEDSSFYGRTMTRTGSALLQTEQAKFGATSVEFDGSNDAIFGPANDPVFELGTRAFTVECFFNADDFSGFQGLVQLYDFNGNDRSWELGLSGGNTGLRWFASVNGSTTSVGINGTTAAPMNTGQWYHAAVSREADGTTRLFLDGVLVGKTTGIFDYHNTGASGVRLGIGMNDGFGNDYNGYIDEVRISVGIARYDDDAGFTVPTAPFNPED